jgi:hypothetical protein
VYWLCQLPGLQQTNSAALEMLIQAVLLKDCDGVTAFHTVDFLLKLTAAGQLSIDAMARLLASALTHHNGDSVNQLVKHPMARQLSSDTVVQLLHTACTRGDTWCTMQLCHLPAAEHISTSELVQLFEAAAKDTECGGHLLLLPIAKQLSCEQAFCLLLQMAAGCHGFWYSEAVRSLPAAQQLDRQHLLQLLQAAVDQGDTGAVTFVCGLPGAKQLCSSSMAQLEELAAEKGHDECLLALRRVSRRREHQYVSTSGT